MNASYQASLVNRHIRRFTGTVLRTSDFIYICKTVHFIFFIFLTSNVSLLARESRVCAFV